MTRVSRSAGGVIVSRSRVSARKWLTSDAALDRPLRHRGDQPRLADAGRADHQPGLGPSGRGEVERRRAATRSPPPGRHRPARWRRAAPVRPGGAADPGERRVGGDHRPLGRPQVGSGRRAQPVGEPVGRLPERGERLRPSTGPGQHDHQLGPEPLPVPVLPGQRAQLVDQPVRYARRRQRQQSVHSGLDRGQPQVLQPGRLGPHDRVVTEVGEGRTAPQREAGVQPGQRQRRLADRQGAPAVGHRPLEGESVRIGRCDVEDVALRHGDHDRGRLLVRARPRSGPCAAGTRGTRPPSPRPPAARCPTCRRRCPASPISCARVAGEHREQRPGRPGHLHHPSVVAELDRAEDVETPQLAAAAWSRPRGLGVRSRGRL